MCRHYLPRMISRNHHGRVLMISSMAGLKPHQLMLHYSMTKTAQISLAAGLAQLTKGTTVTVNSILPGPTATEGFDSFMAGVAKEQNVSIEDATKDFFRTIEPASLLQRPITPAEVASVTLFLSSYHAAAINGAAQRVEGGILRNIV